MEPKESGAGQQNTPQDYFKPVAYDQQGHPLYAHPPIEAAAPTPNQPQMVYLSRPINPEKPELPEEVKRLHDESARKYPSLNLSYGEYIISAVKRHPIGLIQIWLFVLLTIGVFGVLVTLFLQGEGGSEFLGSTDTESAMGSGLLIMVFVGLLAVTGGVVATYVYNNNRFFLTNESVIQEIQTTLFSRHEQTVSLQNIEDASYEQNGILPHLLNYGRIRLSTEGDETTYRFNYVANPKMHIARLNNAVEAFKNGRPVHDG